MSDVDHYNHASATRGSTTQMPEQRCYRLASNRAQFMVELTFISLTNLQHDKSGIEKKRGYSNLVLSIVAEIYLQLS